MSDAPPTYEEIAARLGLSRTTVMALEKRALARLAMQLGDSGPWRRLPPWIKRMGDVGQKVDKNGRNRCSICDVRGHNKRTCPLRGER